MPSQRTLAAAILASGVFGAQAADNNVTTIENKKALCQGCHGIADWKTAFPELYRVPKLVGQNKAYIVSALKAYKSGERDFATMRAIAADLTEADMEAVSKYYGGDAATTAAVEKK